MKLLQVFFGIMILIMAGLLGGNLSSAEVTYYQSWPEKTNVDPHHNWTIKLNQQLDETTVNNENVYVFQDQSPNVEGVEVTINEDQASIIVKAPEQGYKAGEEYALCIEKSIKSADGKELKQPIMMKFTIKSIEDSGDEIVNIPDRGLETVIREELQKPLGDITKDDMLKLEKLNGYQEYTEGPPSKSIISSLEGLQFATNLKTLDLTRNYLDDISPLSNLKNLTSLNLFANDVEDISPLAGLTNLTHLDLYWNHRITDISALENLTSLTYLDLGGNKITDISPLKDLLNLTKLNLNTNKVADISTLSDLNNLTFLDLSDNQISEIDVLSDMIYLKELYVGQNQITDIDVLNNFPELTVLYVNDNQVEDISALTNLTGLTNLSLRGNQIKDISVLANMTNLTTQLDLGQNQITDISALENVVLNLTDLIYVSLTENPLNEKSLEIIKMFRDRGHFVQYW